MGPRASRNVPRGTRASASTRPGDGGQRLSTWNTRESELDRGPRAPSAWAPPRTPRPSRSKLFVARPSPETVPRLATSSKRDAPQHSRPRGSAGREIPSGSAPTCAPQAIAIGQRSAKLRRQCSTFGPAARARVTGRVPYTGAPGGTTGRRMPEADQIEDNFRGRHDGRLARVLSGALRRTLLSVLVLHAP